MNEQSGGRERTLSGRKVGRADHADMAQRPGPAGEVYGGMLNTRGADKDDVVEQPFSPPVSIEDPRLVSMRKSLKHILEHSQTELSDLVKARPAFEKSSHYENYKENKTAADNALQSLQQSLSKVMPVSEYDNLESTIGKTCKLYAHCYLEFRIFLSEQPQQPQPIVTKVEANNMADCSNVQILTIIDQSGKKLWEEITRLKAEAATAEYHKARESKAEEAIQALEKSIQGFIATIQEASKQLQPAAATVPSFDGIVGSPTVQGAHSGSGAGFFTPPSDGQEGMHEPLLGKPQAEKAGSSNCCTPCCIIL